MGHDSRTCLNKYSKREIKEFVEKESTFFCKLNSSFQKHFIKTLSTFLRKKQIVFHAETTQDDSLCLKIGIIFSTLCISEKNLPFIELFHTIQIYPESYKHPIERPFKGTISVKACSNLQGCSALFDMAYGLYQGYLSSTKTLHHFSSRLGKAEIILLDRYDFKKTSSVRLDQRTINEEPLSWFAAATEFFIQKPHKMKNSDPELFDALSLLWDFDFTTYKSPVLSVTSPNVKKNQKSLHPVYYLTLLSIFISSFIIAPLCQVTLLPDWLLLFIIAVFSFLGYFLRSLFFKFNIPIIPLPYTLFCIFGIGMNMAALFLYINIALTTDINPKTTIITQRDAQFIDFYDTPAIAFYTIKYKYNSHISKNLQFKVPSDNEVKFFFVEVKKGFFGIPHISGRSTKPSL